MANLCFFLLLLLTAVSRTTSTTCDISIPINYNGTIESPGFPDEYYGDQNCSYSLQFSSLGIWHINFTFFNLPNTSCDTDYLEVDYNLSQQRYCHNSPPPNLTNIYQFRFVSSFNASAGYGFQARVSMALECGMTDIRLQENIPLFLYYNYLEPVEGRCEWRVTADQGLSIMMIGNTNSNDYEFIKSKFKIYKGTTKDQSSLINFQTKNNEFAVDEASNTILIEYIADVTFYFELRVTFRAYKASQNSTCGSEIYAENGEGDIGLIANELQYIEGMYRNRICAWTIEAEENEVIQLVVTEFRILTEIPGCNDSARSYLEIYDGSQAASSLLVRYKLIKT
ncbi:cubilin-like [Pomacea canaliculata]|nr:cubilin-like [Pomacea canaliculata]